VPADAAAGASDIETIQVCAFSTVPDIQPIIATA
jgi:hypothetical protein